VRNLLDRHLPHGFAHALAGACDAGETRAANLSAGQSARLAEFLSGMPLHVTGTEGFEKAMVTRGGVALREIRSDVLESRLVRGLFLAGEILDLDGPCGGFNLQWAFSSGFLAGTSAAGY
jgi:predicted flavoprotein YhiN